MNNFISKKSGCGLFTIRAADREYFRRLQNARQAVGIDPTPRGFRVALHSRLDKGAKSEAELFQAVAKVKGLVQ
jgi:hypothetical protein